MSDYLPEHIKKIEIDTSNIDSFMEKIQDYSELDQTWLIKKLIMEIEDTKKDTKKELEISLKLNLSRLKDLEAIEKESPNLKSIKKAKQHIEECINRVKKAMKKL